MRLSQMVVFQLFAALCLTAATTTAFGQNIARSVAPPEPAINLYYDPVQGVSSLDVVRRALASNKELSAARLDIERARARLVQAGLRPNPSLDFEQSTGRLVGSPGERETSIGVSIPLELGGKRSRRIDLARAELAAVEAEIADRERRLTGQVLTAYVEALSALRELEVTENLNNLDTQTASIVEARVSEGEAAPLELNLLRTEVDRLRARRRLTEGRLQAALLRLKNLAGIPPDEPLQLRETLTRVTITEPPASQEAAIEVALRTRPDLKLAWLTEDLAEAGLRLARAQGLPGVTAFTRYSVDNTVFENTLVGILRDRDKALTFGVTISIPLFNRNQGAVAEAGAAIAQAHERRQFIESGVRAEVSSAFQRVQVAEEALSIYEKGVITRSAENVNAVRVAYQLGEYRATELLAEQRRALDSQREFTEALAERYRALADLQMALGVIPSPK